MGHDERNAFYLFLNKWNIAPCHWHDDNQVPILHHLILLVIVRRLGLNWWYFCQWCWSHSDQVLIWWSVDLPPQAITLTASYHLASSDVAYLGDEDRTGQDNKGWGWGFGNIARLPSVALCCTCNLQFISWFEFHNLPRIVMSATKKLHMSRDNSAVQCSD